MLSINNLVCRMGGRTLIDGSSASLNDGWKVGIVGANGAGKSTLFKLLTGELEPDGGSISMPARQRVGVVRQEMPDTDTPLIELVLEADTERMSLLAECETETDGNRLAEVYSRLEEIDAYAAPARAATILAGLGFTEEQINGPYNALSGGWRMRVSLAAVLFLQPELLLLDEPTNHLDLEAIIWLEQYLANYPHTLLIISHDRELLNVCADHILHLHDQKLTLYNGNYDTFERTRAERQMLQQKQHEKQQAQRAHIQKFIDRFKAKATKARQAQSRIKMLERMDIVDAVMADRSVRFTFPSPKELSPPLVSINKANIGYGSKTILYGVHETIDKDDRIALLGANGNGKSTLMKLLAGKLQPLTGELSKSNKLKIGYFAQHQADELDVTTTPYFAMRRRCEELGEETREPVVRGRLGTFGFGKELSDNLIGSLSGGEKARLLFALISVQAPHILLLDEPTNHLDMDARSALVDALNNYEGAVVIVSHDPSMLERVADRLWLIHDGKVQDFDGDLADYRKFIISNRRANRRQEKVAKGDEKGDTRRAAADLRKQLQPLAQAVQEAEKEVHRLTAEKHRLEMVMGDAGFYDNPKQVTSVQLSYGHVCKQLSEQEKRWIEAAEAYEQAKAEA